MDNKKVFRLICVVLVQIAILDIILGVLVIKKAGGSKNTVIENSVANSPDTAVKQSTGGEAKASQVKSRELINKSIEERIAFLIYKKPVTFYYPNPDSVNISLFKRNYLSLIYSKSVIPYSPDDKPQNISQKYLSFIYRKPLYNVSETGDIKLAADEPFMQDYTATAYDLSYESCGKLPGHREYGITFSGKKAVKGRTVAVDPSLIPLGSLVYIKFPKPYQQMTGWYTAEDTGSKIKGKIIDIFLGESALKEAHEFGRRKVEIMVLNGQ